ncbi:MAG: hypothetical protein M3Y33_00170 [Actinomycetota bacterium]|nr:hypothetical protein [Actinomycetota bacterium]
MNVDALREFFADFDKYRSGSTEVEPVSDALAEASMTASRRDPFDEVLKYGNLRVPQFSIIGMSSRLLARERLVANHPQAGYADARLLAEALGDGAVVRVERPDQRSPQLRAGLSSIQDDLAAGRLGCYQLYLQPTVSHGSQPRSLHFDCGSARYLVTQLAGTTAWGSADTRLGPGHARYLHAGGDGACRPLSPSILFVMAFVLPDTRSLRYTLAQGFLAHLQESGEAERHHLVAADAKADWLRGLLSDFLADPSLSGRHDRLNLLRPAAEEAPLTVGHCAALDRIAAEKQDDRA